MYMTVYQHTSKRDVWCGGFFCFQKKKKKKAELKTEQTHLGLFKSSHAKIQKRKKKEHNQIKRSYLNKNFHFFFFLLFQSK